MVLLALVGCSGQEKRAVVPLPPPPPPLVASPSPTALVVPAAAQAATPQGAAAFARFYINELSRGFNTGDMSAVRRLSHPQCSFCSEVSDATEKQARSGLKFSGGVYTVRFAEAAESAPGDALVDVDYSRSASRTATSDDVLVKQRAAEPRGSMLVRTVQSGGGWLVRGVRFSTDRS